MESYQAVAEDFKKKLEAFKANKTQFTFVGHSFGGAMSTLTAYFAPNTTIKTVITYGCPKLGDDAFVSSYNAKNISTFRLINDKDPVPSLPLTAQGFREIYPEYWIVGGQLRECLGDCRRGLTLEVDDHRIASYIANLRQPLVYVINHSGRLEGFEWIILSMFVLMYW